MLIQMAAKLKHLLIIEDSRGLHEYTLDAPMHTIGRDPKCDIRLASQFVSRRQATLVQMSNEDGSFHYRLVDGVPKGKLSSNGMKVNGQKVLACDLQDEDEIVFGPQVRAVYRLYERDLSRPKEFDETLIPGELWQEEKEQFKNAKLKMQN